VENLPMNDIDYREMGNNLMKQALELWINPEIERRKQNNTLPDNFSLNMVRVIMNFNSPNEIRFNNEVKVILKGRLVKDITEHEGRQVNIDEVMEKINRVVLTENDPNAGHFTMILHRGFWHIEFDFRYNATLCLEHYNAAKEFLESAKISMNRNNFRAFIDNLFSATELIAKAKLLMHDKTVFNSKKHGTVHARYNQYGNYGNIESKYTKLLNQLSSLRPKARYVQSNFSISKEDAKKMFKIALEMHEDLLINIPEIVDIEE
jgi:uncharacterized protein (UPF0332 family)